MLYFAIVDGTFLLVRTTYLCNLTRNGLRKESQKFTNIQSSITTKERRIMMSLSLESISYLLLQYSLGDVHKWLRA